MNSTQPINIPTSVSIDLLNGNMSPFTVHDIRRVSNLVEQYSDELCAKELIGQTNPIVYEIYHHTFITNNSDMAMGMSIIAPGKVGIEYFMTKGHLHEQYNQPEIYYCVKGSGYLLLDDFKNDFQAPKFSEGVAVHIPPQYAHRVVNIGDEQLIFVSAFHVAAGHVYEPVTKYGFAQLVVEENGKAVLKANPRRMALKP